jgi:hypothetical protein
MIRMDTDTVPLALPAASIIGGERLQNIYESWDESPGYKSSMGWAFWIQIEYKIENNHLKIGPVQLSSKAKNKGDDAVSYLWRFTYALKDAPRYESTEKLTCISDVWRNILQQKMNGATPLNCTCGASQKPYWPRESRGTT